MSDEETDTFIDSEMGPENEPEIDTDTDPVTDTDTDEEPKIDMLSLKELRENISRNSLEIDDLKNKRDTISSNKSDVSEDMTLTPRKIKYVYSNTFEEHDSDVNEWSDIKRYRFQKCLWRLKYNRIVSSFYFDNLKKSEHKWSWMIIVISTLTSGLTVANNVDKSNAPIENYNTYVNILLTTSSMTTSLIAAWIKKQMFIEKINEIDKYLYELNALCEDLEIQLSLLNIDRLKYDEFKKKYIPGMTQYLTTNPFIPPLEWKRCIREITLDYPELLNIDDSEDNKMWPWYGDLILDPNNDGTNESEINHVRYPTTFYRKFKKTNKEKITSSCCRKKPSKTVYDNN